MMTRGRPRIAPCLVERDPGFSLTRSAFEGAGTLLLMLATTGSGLTTQHLSFGSPGPGLFISVITTAGALVAFDHPDLLSPKFSKGSAHHCFDEVLAMTPDGLTIYLSKHEPKETMARLEAAVIAHGMGIVASVDHAQAAMKAGLELRPIHLLIFGNARAGTPLMQIAPTMGIDLPLKALVWQDEAGRTWLAHDDPGRLARRHGVHDGMESILRAMTDVLSAVAEFATADVAEKSS